MSVSHGGILVALLGAHPAAAEPVVRTLLEGHAPGDDDAPRVMVCFSPRELLEAPVGARVVLVGAERDPAWLNLHRPVIRERSLAVFLWLDEPEFQALRTSAPDLADWVSHRIRIPPMPSSRRVQAELLHAMEHSRWIAVTGEALVRTASSDPRRTLHATAPYETMIATLRRDDTVIHGVDTDQALLRVSLADLEAGGTHYVILAEPSVVPPQTPVVDGRPTDWEAMTDRLRAQGVPHPGVEAALRGLCDPPPPPEPSSTPRVLVPSPRHQHLLALTTQGKRDLEAAGLALSLGLRDVARCWVRGSASRMSRQELLSYISGSLEQRRTLALLLVELVEQAVASTLPTVAEHPELRSDVVHEIIELMLRDEGQALRRWDPARGTVESHVLALARGHAKTLARRIHMDDP